MTRMRTINVADPQRRRPGCRLSKKVKLRFKKPGGNGDVQSIERSVTDDWVDFTQAPPDLKFAAAVAEFGMILRESEYKGNATLGTVLQWAQEGRGSDADGYRAGFIELVRKAQALRKG